MVKHLNFNITIYIIHNLIMLMIFRDLGNNVITVIHKSAFKNLKKLVEL